MGMDALGKLLVMGGLLVVGIGLLLLLVGKLPLLGKFPGDIVIRTDNFTLYIPLVTMVLVSVILTIILNVLSRISRG